MIPSAPAILALAVFASQLVPAQPGGERVPDAVKPGLRVSIVDTQGQKIDGRVDAVSEHAVRLLVRGASTEIPIGQILRIDQPDGVKNGALTGLGLGLGVGLIGAAAAQDRNLLVSALGNGIIWAGLGALFDAAFDSRRTLYQRGARIQVHVSPVFFRAQDRAIAVSLSW